MYLVAAVLASAIAVIAVSAVLAFLLDLSIEYGLVTALLLLGAAEMVFAIVIFVPVNLMRKRLGRMERVAYIATGALIPAIAALSIAPTGVDAISWAAKLVSTAAIAATGAAGAFAFALVAAQANVAPESESL